MPPGKNTEFLSGPQEKNVLGRQNGMFWIGISPESLSRELAARGQLDFERIWVGICRVLKGCRMLACAVHGDPSLSLF